MAIVNIPFILELRQTRRYVGTYQHLDQWGEIGSGTITEQRVFDVDDEDPCETTRRVFLCEVTSDAPDADVERAIYDGFSSHGCAHEYDCCGCWSTMVTRVKKLPSGKWAFVTSASRNY